MPPSSKSGRPRQRPTEIIDVDEYAQKFQPSPNDIIDLDAKEFRRSVREGKRKLEHTSSIGEAIKTARALHGPPALKRQKTVPLPPQPLIPHRIVSEHRVTRSPSASSSAGHPLAVKRPMATLEISDSDDDDIATLLQERPPKRPRTSAQRPLKPANRSKAVHKPDIIELSDGSDLDAEHTNIESDWDPPGWDLNDEARWTPMRTNSERVENLAASLETMTIKSSTPLVTCLLPRIENTTRFKPNPIVRTRRQWTKPEYVWEVFPSVFRPRLQPRSMGLPTQPIVRTWKEAHQPLFSSRCVTKFKQSPGAIHNVQQKGKWTIITSGCIGGEPDTDEEDRSPYNHSGSLITYDAETRNPEIPVGHVRAYKRKSNPAETWTKNYALHDAQFDPLHDMFISSGADRRVMFWGLAQDDDMEQDVEPEIFGTNPSSCWRKEYELSFSYPPNQVAFRPPRLDGRRSPGSDDQCSPEPDDQRSLVAIAERRVHIISLTGNEKPHKEVDFRLFTKKNQPHVVGTMVWGHGPTTDCLFASSEPDPLSSRDNIRQALFDGRHRAFDVESEEIMYDLQVEEAGDSLCINHSGTTLALTTISENHSTLRLFDVGRKDKRPTSAIDVDPYPSAKDRGFEKYEGEITSTAFSPDGVFLALGRNDNTIHVYDVRYLRKGPLYELEHFGECRSAGTEKYGIAKVEWLHSQQTRRIALATAGEDGCVRLWNPMKAMDEDNGQIIAEVNSDIGHFSIGDPYQGENRLVVGDLSGQVSFFDLET